MRNRMFLLFKAELADRRTRILLLVGLPLFIILNNLAYYFVYSDVISYNNATQLINVIFSLSILKFASSAFLKYHCTRTAPVIMMLPLSNVSKFIYSVSLYLLLLTAIYTIIFYGSYLLWKPILDAEETFLGLKWVHIWNLMLFYSVLFFSVGMFFRRLQFVLAFVILFIMWGAFGHSGVINIMGNDVALMVLSTLLFIATWVCFNRKQIK